MKEEAAGSRAGIDGVSQTFKLNALLLKFPYEIDQVLDAATQPVELPDYKGVALTEAFTSLDEPGSLSSASAHPVFEDLLASSFLESFGLQFQILVLGRDTRVSNQHASILRSASAYGTDLLDSGFFLELVCVATM